MYSSLVSVVIPVFNVEDYLHDTLTSIMSQTYKNIEVIMINDGSTDGSESICLQFVEKDKRFKYYYQENSGAPIARNYGMKLAKGKYLLLFDSDDLLLENAIEVMVNTIETDKSDLVIGNYVLLKLEEETRRYKNIKENVNSIEDLFYTSPFPNNKLIRFEKVKNIDFNNVRIAQDANFFYKLLPNISKYSVIDIDICKYRILDNSISSYCDSRILDVIKSLEYVEKFYFENGVDESYLIMLYKSKIKHLINQSYKLINSKKNDNDFLLFERIEDEIIKTFKTLKTNIRLMQIKDLFYFYYLKLKFIKKKRW